MLFVNHLKSLPIPPLSCARHDLEILNWRIQLVAGVKIEKRGRNRLCMDNVSYAEKAGNGEENGVDEGGRQRSHRGRGRLRETKTQEEMETETHTHERCRHIRE